MNEVVWLLEAVVQLIHDEQVREHGGLEGVRDRIALQSALGRPRRLIDYGDPAPDLAALAAAYAYGLARNHPFNDGNKRTALVVLETFLSLNDRALRASDADCVAAMEGLAAGEVTEDALARWIRDRL